MMRGQEQLEMLKQEYQNIKVPTETLAVIQTGIQKAKQEMKEERHYTLQKQRRWAKGILAAILVIGIAVPNISPNVAMAMEEIPGFEKIVRIVTLGRYDQVQKQYEAHVETPELSAQGDAVLQSSVGEINEEVQAYADQMIAKFQQEKKEGDGVYGISVRYNVVTDNAQWFTLQVTTLETMASGAESVRYYNLDKQTGAYVQLADLFPEGVDYITPISEAIKAQMRKQMAVDETVCYFIDSDMPEDDFQQIKADQNFYVTQEGTLVIAFDEYEVAPGSMGAVEFSIEDTLVKTLQNKE